MIVYWLLFAFPAVLALLEQSPDRPRPRFTYTWLLMSVALVLLIGFRWETGGDWANYNGMVVEYYWQRLFGKISDPAFDILLWTAAHMRSGILLVTVVSGMLMSYALTRFCLAQPRPWLAMVVSIPFLVLIMGMGYIRQGMAIALLMLGILTLRNRSIWRFAAYVASAATFHSTAVVLMPFVGLAGSRYRFLTIVLAVILTIGLTLILLFGRFDQFQNGYVNDAMSSSGAVVRLLMTALASGALLIFISRFDVTARERAFWRAFAIAPPALLLLLPFFASSTVLDRLGLFFLPLQTFVAGQLPDAIGRDRSGRLLVAIGIIVLYGAALYVWLNYAVNVSAWLPYRFYFFEDQACAQC